MDLTGLKSDIEQLASDIILIDPEDVQQIVPLHTTFEELSIWAEKEEDASLITATNNTLKLVELLMLSEVENIQGAMEQISAMVTGIQQIICEGRDINEVSFPASLMEGQINDTICETDTAIIEGSEKEIDIDLISEFILESREHLDSSDSQLLVIEKDPGNIDAINAVFRAFHTIKGVAGFLNLDAFRDIAHEAETILDKTRKGEATFSVILVDVMFEVSDGIRLMLSTLESRIDSGSLPEEYQGTELLIDKIKNAAKGKVVLSGDVNTKDQTSVTASTQTFISTVESVKVDSKKLDYLIDMIGEMVIEESMVSRISELLNIDSNEFNKHLAKLDKISRELQEIGMSLRMIPLNSTFQKMKKIVRDLSRKFNKKVELKINGAETELDKFMVEKIGDPLLHIIRNAVDHGIENSAEDRIAAGKPETGEIQINAYHKSGNIVIDIVDDGAGINKEMVRERAIERGLITIDEEISDSDLYLMIFHPGFSTAATVTDVSGRGVGMDVVRKNIEELRGTVEVESTPGKGTIISIRLPLTLSIIDGLIIRCGGERFIIPTLSVIESLRPSLTDISEIMKSGELIKFHGNHIPLLYLNDIFKLGDSRTAIEEGIVIVVETDQKKIALAVDELMGQQQIVIKSLEGSMRNLMGVSGCTIMSDGQVGLILDIAGLAKLAGKHY